MDKVTELEIRTLCFSSVTTHFEPFRFATKPNSVFQKIAAQSVSFGTSFQ